MYCYNEMICLYSYFSEIYLLYFKESSCRLVFFEWYNYLFKKKNKPTLRNKLSIYLVYFTVFRILEFVGSGSSRKKKDVAFSILRNWPLKQLSTADFNRYKFSHVYFISDFKVWRNFDMNRKYTDESVTSRGPRLYNKPDQPLYSTHWTWISIGMYLQCFSYQWFFFEKKGYLL